MPTKEERDEIIALFRQVGTVDGVARMVGRSSNCVANVIDTANLDRLHRAPVTDGERARLISLYRRTGSLRKVAQESGRTLSVVAKVIANAKKDPLWALDCEWAANNLTIGQYVAEVTRRTAI